MKNGKVSLGYKQKFKTLRKEKLKAIFVTHNIAYIIKIEVNWYSRLSNISIYHYLLNNIDLGSEYGRYNRVNILWRNFKFLQ